MKQLNGQQAAVGSVKTCCSCGDGIVTANRTFPSDQPVASRKIEQGKMTESRFVDIKKMPGQIVVTSNLSELFMKTSWKTSNLKPIRNGRPRTRAV